MALAALWLILGMCCWLQQCDALTLTHHHSFDRQPLRGKHFRMSVLGKYLLNETVSISRQSNNEKHALHSEGDNQVSQFQEKEVQAQEPLSKLRVVVIVLLFVVSLMAAASNFQAVLWVWNVSRAFKWFCLASYIGVLGGLISFLYMNIMIHGLTIVWTYLPQALHENVFSSHPEHCLYIITAVGGLFWGLLALRICPKMPMVNMNDWIHAIHSTGSVEPRAFFLPVLILSAFNIILGSSLGPEGPLVLAGGALGTWIARLAGQDEVGTRCCSMCGGASMLAVFFGFPFIPAIFVLESPHLNGMQYTELLMPVIWASIVSALVSRFWEGGEMQCDPNNMGFTCFSYTIPKHMHESDVVMAIVYGTIAAVIAGLQIGLIKRAKQSVEWLVARSSTPLPVVTALGGLIVGVIAIYFPHALFSGEFQMQALTDADPGSYPVPWLYRPMLSRSLINTLIHPDTQYLCIAASKAFSVAICISIGYCGGVVFPVMLVGLGFSWVLFPGNSVAALCIMFGVLAAVCRVPVSAILLGAFSMRPKIGLQEEGAISGLGVMLASLSVSVIVATVLTSWYPLFETGDRKDFPLRMTAKLSTEESAAADASCLQSKKHEDGLVHKNADCGVHPAPGQERDDAGAVAAESTEGAVAAAAAHALLGKALSAPE